MAQEQFSVKYSNLFIQAPSPSIKSTGKQKTNTSLLPIYDYSRMPSPKPTYKDLWNHWNWQKLNVLKILNWQFGSENIILITSKILTALFIVHSPRKEILVLLIKKLFPSILILTFKENLILFVNVLNVFHLKRRKKSEKKYLNWKLS